MRRTLALAKVATDFIAGRDDCDLLGAVGIAVQLAITVVCAIALIAVWACETPRRPFLTWVFDISKQVVGSAYGKLYNIAQAMVFAELLRGSPDQRDQCVWYLMGIATDCFLTTFLCWGANDFMRPIILKRYGINIGDYDGKPATEVPVTETNGSDETNGHAKSSKNHSVESIAAMEPPSKGQSPVRMWLVQVGIWLAIITAVRLVVSVGFFLTQHHLYIFYYNVFVVFGLDTPTEKLVFAVLIFPAFADTFQIVVQDMFLKKPKVEPLEEVACAA